MYAYTNMHMYVLPGEDTPADEDSPVDEDAPVALAPVPKN
jgi:hypothetical protein